MFYYIVVLHVPDREMLLVTEQIQIWLTVFQHTALLFIKLPCKLHLEQMLIKCYVLVW